MQYIFYIINHLPARTRVITDFSVKHSHLFSKKNIWLGEMGSGRNNSKVYPDIKKNRLYITVSGGVSKKDMERIYTDIRFTVPDLQSGFDVITDLTQCRIGHLNGISIFKNIMTYLVANKVGRIVRVVGRAKIIFSQLSKITESIEDYRPIYTSTLEEAEKKLAP